MKNNLTRKSFNFISDSDFTKLEHAVFKDWPTSQHLPSNRTSLSVFDHAQSFIRANPIRKTEYRRDEFRNFFKEKIEHLLGAEVAQSVRKQLAANHSIATAQHYTPLSPKTLNPTLTMALAYFDRKEAERENVIVLACSGISFNNHWYPRGHLFHSLVGDTIVENQINFFGRSVDADPVVTADGYTEQTKKNMTKVLLHYRSEKLIKKRELNKIIQILDDIYFTKEVLSQKKLTDQLTITNFYVWKKLFETYIGKKPNLIFLSQEKIAAELLQRYHMTTDTLLSHVLFDPAWHKLIYKYFNNIMCAFSVERKYGTFLFWATPPRTNTRIQLFAKEGVLVSEDNRIRIPLTPDAISQALLREEIAPSTMLTFLVLSLYYGFFLTGGLDQPTYLTQTKQAYLSLLEELGLEEERTNCLPIVSNDIVLTRPSLAFIDGPNEQRVHASVMDLLVHGNSNSWTSIMEVSKQITVQDILYRLFPELYRDYCKTAEKEEKLLSITERDIEHYTGIDKKIPSWEILSNQ